MLVTQHGQVTAVEAGLAVAATLAAVLVVAILVASAVIPADLAAVALEDSVVANSEVSARRQLFTAAVLGQPHVSREMACVWPVEITPGQVAYHKSITVRLPDLRCGRMARQAWTTARHGFTQEGPGQLGGSKIASKH